MNTFFLRDTSQHPELLLALHSLLSEHVPVPVLVVPLHEQLSLVRSLPLPVINLDPFSRLPAHFALDVCRIFLPDEQQQPIRYAARPGYNPLSAQIHSIPPGEYLLLDDDICTGGTVEFVQQYLLAHRKDVVVQHHVSLLDLWRAQHAPQSTLYDVCDSHDFIPTHPMSGLVVEEHSAIKRFSYTDSHVNLVTRAKLQEPATFCLRWKAILSHHLKTEPNGLVFKKCKGELNHRNEENPGL
jgi:hypothetical protein